MLKDCYKVLGLMSGTSLDGLDIIEVEFWHDENWHFSIHNAETIPYPQNGSTYFRTLLPETWILSMK
jgi:anhydro-N-acetylmuramic acid kinase